MPLESRHVRWKSRIPEFSPDSGVKCSFLPLARMMTLSLQNSSTSSPNSIPLTRRIRLVLDNGLGLRCWYIVQMAVPVHLANSPDVFGGYAVANRPQIIQELFLNIQ